MCNGLVRGMGWDGCHVQRPSPSPGLDRQSFMGIDEGRRSHANRSGRGQRSKTPRVEDLDPAEAMEVLRRLTKRRDAVGEAIRAEIVNVATQVHPDAIVAQVHADLSALTVEDLWDRSGRTSHGYVHPAEESWVMVEEVVTPHVERTRQLQKWGRRAEAREYCLAVLGGIYTYAHESDSEFKDHSPDDPAEAFRWVYSSWKRGERDGAALAEFEREIAGRFPEWTR